VPKRQRLAVDCELRETSGLLWTFAPLGWHVETVTESENSSVQVSVIWPGVDDLPVLRSNIALVQVGSSLGGGPEDIILVLGHVAPPVLLGTPEEQQASMRTISAVTARSLVRVSMSRDRVAALVQALQGTIDQIDDALGGAQ